MSFRVGLGSRSYNPWQLHLVELTTYRCSRCQWQRFGRRPAWVETKIICIQRNCGWLKNRYSDGRRRSGHKGYRPQVARRDLYTIEKNNITLNRSTIIQTKWWLSLERSSNWNASLQRELHARLSEKRPEPFSSTHIEEWSNVINGVEKRQNNYSKLSEFLDYYIK